MEIKLTDKPGMAEGYSDEKLDCAVRALAVALDIPYYQAHDVFAACGRKRRHGSYNTIDTLGMLGIIGFHARVSLSKFIEDNPVGVFYIIKRGHAFAVKNGV